MAKMMKAAVVRDLGSRSRSRRCRSPSRRTTRSWSVSRPPESATPICMPPRETGRSSRPALHPRPRGRRDGSRYRPRRAQRQGRRPRRHSMAAHGLRVLLVLPHRLGDVVRFAAEQRLFDQRQLRRICGGRPELCRPPPGQPRVGPCGADPVRRRDRLQGTQGDRGEAGRMGGDLRDRRSRPHGGPVRQGDGHACGGRRRACRQARAGQVSSAPRSR